MKSVEEIEKIIKDLGLDFDKVTINKDNSIDYNGDVKIAGKNLDIIPLQFNIVKGDFNCYGNNLTSLKGSPQKCNNFYYNKWDSIKKVTFKEPVYILKILKQKKLHQKTNHRLLWPPGMKHLLTRNIKPFWMLCYA